MIAQSITLGEYTNRYIRQRDLDQTYAEQIKSRVRIFEEWYGSPIPITELEDDLVNEFLISLKGQVKPRTIKGYRGNILCVWNGVCEDQKYRHLTERPGRIRTEKIPDVIIEAWTLEEIEALILVCRNLTGLMRDTIILLSHWWEARVRVGYDTALRHSDIMQLLKDDIRPSGIIELCQGKTGHRHIVQLSEKTIQCIHSIGWDGPEVFPWTWRREKFFSDLKDLVRQAGITEGTGKFLRRSGASYADREQPGAGKQLLGHRSSRVFQESYECKRITQPQVVRPPAID